MPKINTYLSYRRRAVIELGYGIRQLDQISSRPSGGSTKCKVP